MIQAFTDHSSAILRRSKRKHKNNAKRSYSSSYLQEEQCFCLCMHLAIGKNFVKLPVSNHWMLAKYLSILQAILLHLQGGDVNKQLKPKSVM